MKYDVIVVGSGAGGGMVADNLTRAGIKVLMLEAGRSYDPRSETAMFHFPHQAPLRGESTPDKEMGFFDATIGGSSISGEPYTVADGTEFLWWRARMLGGRTNHWGRQVPRYGPDDFKTFTNTGREMDWPVSYDQMANYYDRTERLIGVFGPDENDAVYNSPMPPNSIRQMPPAPRISELLFAQACSKMGLKTHAHPTAILTKPLNGRSACLYATNCLRGCSIGAGFDSILGFINPARATGHLSLITEAVVVEVITDESGRKATGVRYVDKATNLRKEAYARVVVLAASTIETCRILLNSKQRMAPNGLGNSSGLVGKYLSDTTSTSLLVQLPQLENCPPHNEDGVSQPHIYAPWQLHGDEKTKAGADFSGGYKLEIDPYRGGRFGVPTMTGTFHDLLRTAKGYYGKTLKNHLRRCYGSVVGLRALGSMTLNENCYIEIDSTVRDKWGVPVPKVHWQWSDDDLRRQKHMHKTLHMVAENMKAVIIFDPFKDKVAARNPTMLAGSASHEVGGCRMGDNPINSVLNRWSQTWDVINLYVCDGAPFVTHAEKNPTLTIMALALRASDNIIQRLQRGEI